MRPMGSLRGHSSGYHSASGPSGSALTHPIFLESLRTQRHWWLWSAGAVAVVLMVLETVPSLAVPGSPSQSLYSDALKWTVRGLIALILLAGVCGIYQQLQTFRLRRRLLEAEKLFYLIGDSGSDLIAIVDTNG